MESTKTRHHNTKHGMSNSPEYNSWRAMHKRCLDKNYHAYNRYGGAGIKIHPEWQGKGGFEAFYKYIGPRPANTTLDRIDRSKDYEPGNVRWASPLQQTLNRKRNKLNKTGYRGVSVCRGSYEVHVYKDSVGCYVGRFKDPVDAAYVYDQFMMQLHGVDALLNFEYV